MVYKMLQFFELSYLSGPQHQESITLLWCTGIRTFYLCFHYSSNVSYTHLIVHTSSQLTNSPLLSVFGFAYSRLQFSYTWCFLLPVISVYGHHLPVPMLLCHYSVICPSWLISNCLQDWIDDSVSVYLI